MRSLCFGSYLASNMHCSAICFALCAFLAREGFTAPAVAESNYSPSVLWRTRGSVKRT